MTNIHFVRSLIRQVDALPDESVMLPRHVIRPVLFDLALMLETQGAGDTKKTELIKALILEFMCLSMLDMLNGMKHSGAEKLPSSEIIEIIINYVNGVMSQAKDYSEPAGKA